MFIGGISGVLLDFPKDTNKNHQVVVPQASKNLHTSAEILKLMWVFFFFIFFQKELRN